MDKKHIIESPSGFKAVNAFIFAGSFSLGTMKAGFDLLKVLEISDDQLKQNTFYFKKNVEDVPVILPSAWENESYLKSLNAESIDLMCCNCPCSSLSMINRNASVSGKNNVHFYRLFSVFKQVQPKVFIIENAPTLVKLGYPILRDMVHQLSGIYRFTVVRDYAGNHEVAMPRQRTLVFGWHKSAFERIPVLKEDSKPRMTVKDAFAGILDSKAEGLKSVTVDDLRDLFKHAVPGHSLMTGLAMKWLEDASMRDMLETRLKGTPHFKELKRVAAKVAEGKSCWDKTPVKLDLEGRFPSLTSVNEYLHPVQDRMISLRELARIMNYPDWYDFTDPDRECTIPVTQAVAQGVPANFGKYAAMQARHALEGSLESVDEPSAALVFQHHSKHKASWFALDELDSMHMLDVKPEQNFSLKD